MPGGGFGVSARHRAAGLGPRPYGRLRDGFYGLETVMVLLVFLALLREPRAEPVRRSTLTIGACPAPLTGGSTADGMIKESCTQERASGHVDSLLGCASSPPTLSAPRQFGPRRSWAWRLSLC